MEDWIFLVTGTDRIFELCFQIEKIGKRETAVKFEIKADYRPIKPWTRGTYSDCKATNFTFAKFNQIFCTTGAKQR